MKTLFNNCYSIVAKQQILVICCIGAIVCLLTSCDKYRTMMWYLYVDCNDSVKVEYPIPDSAVGEPTLDNILVPIEVIHDTILPGSNYTRGYDYKNINVYISRKSKNHDVRVLFIDRDMFSDHIYTPNVGYNKQVFDSLMAIYGVTIPVGTDVMTIPIAGLSYGNK